MTYNYVRPMEIDGREIEVELLLEWVYDNGVYLEPQHSRNGYGKGWYCNDLQARDYVTKQPLSLSDRQIEEVLEAYHPTNIPTAS